jgi:hypothetical protein
LSGGVTIYTGVDESTLHDVSPAHVPLPRRECRKLILENAQTHDVSVRIVRQEVLARIAAVTWQRPNDVQHGQGIGGGLLYADVIKIGAHRPGEGRRAKVVAIVYHQTNVVISSGGGGVYTPELLPAISL